MGVPSARDGKASTSNADITSTRSLRNPKNRTDFSKLRCETSARKAAPALHRRQKQSAMPDIWVRAAPPLQPVCEALSPATSAPHYRQGHHCSKSRAALLPHSAAPGCDKAKDRAPNEPP